VANGCAAHTMNLLIGDICSLEEWSPILAKATQVVKYVKERHLLLAKFRIVSKQLNNAISLKLPVPTRWYTQFNCLDSLLESKAVLRYLYEKKLIPNVPSRQRNKLEEFNDLIMSEAFWTQMEHLADILKIPTNLIGTFENDSTTVTQVYGGFTRMLRHFEGISGMKSIVDIVKYRWNFMHTESMGMSHLFKPKNLLSKHMEGTDFLDTIRQSKEYFEKYYPEENQHKECIEEFTRYAIHADLFT
jgi:hypothetical protein